MHKFFVLCLLSAGLLLSREAFASCKDVTLGVLEHYKYEVNMRGDPEAFVRVVFRAIAGEWQSFDGTCIDERCLSLYPSQMNWTITFDGKQIGQLRTVRAKQFRWVSSVGEHLINEHHKIPTIGKPSDKFVGWGHGRKAYRPLVAVSQPNYRDPDMWKPSPLNAEDISLARAAFRSRFPDALRCADPYENKPQPWRYVDSDIKVTKSYRSNKTKILVEMRLRDNNCDGVIEGAFSSNWFVIYPDKKSSYLDEGMTLIDAGDYDNDGKSEVIFQISRYNRDGYTIYYKDFSKHVSFEFSLH